MHWCYFVCLELDLFSELACGGSLKGKDGGGMLGADGSCCCGCKDLDIDDAWVEVHVDQMLQWKMGHH